MVRARSKIIKRKDKILKSSINTSLSCYKLLRDELSFYYLINNNHEIFNLINKEIIKLEELHRQMN